MIKKKEEKALTAVEMLVVIAIIGILTSFALAVFANFQESIELSGSARELISDLRYVQQLSVSEQIRHGIKFLNEQRKYQLIRYGENEETLKEKELPNNVFFQSINGLDDNIVRFNPYGASEKDGSVVLANTQGESRTILIRPSGFVKIY